MRIRQRLYNRRVKAGLLVGLGAAALVFAADALLTSASRDGLSPLALVEIETYDWRMRLTAQPASARPDIALVDIDEYSLRNLQPNAGRWPWPRAVHSLLIDYLARAPAKIIAYDIDFAEADTRRGFDFGRTTISGAESDQELVDSVKAAGSVILLADAVYEAQEGAGAAMPESGIHTDAPGPVERRVIFPPFASLAAASSALGHNLFVLDPDGSLRHTIPLVRSGSHIVPSFGLAVALKMAGIAPRDVRLEGDVLHVGDRSQPLSWRTVLTPHGDERYLWGLIDYRGPAQLSDLVKHTYPTYSFFDLEYSEEQILAGVTPKIDPAVFRDKVVFVGATASGLRDVFQTPFASSAMGGLHIHAAVADDLLSRRFMRTASPSVRIISVIVSGLAIGLVATLMPAWWATALTIAAASVFGWAAIRAFADSYWIDVTQPLTAAGFALFGGVAYQYFVEGRERRKMKRLFGQYVSKDVFDQLVADPSLARLGGQRRDMTVLFSDIRGFTTVSEQGQPEAIVGMLNEYFSEMVAIVFRHGGTLDKFVGDMVMALFGAPLDDARHAVHAAEAALDMVAALAVLNERWRSEGRPVLDIGIGINSGPMIAGNIGSSAIMSYTVIGDAVNLGARLESLNKDYGTRIIISQSTREQLGDRYTARPLGDVVVKGKTQPVAILELTGRT
jgi:adenylate cyclase